MKLAKTILPLVLVWLCWTAVRATAQMPPASSPLPQYVLLRNGQLLRGNVTQSGDRIDVAFAGGEARLRAEQVELVAESESVILQARRARINLQRADARAELARWCLRQELWESAASELSELRRLAPNDPQWELLSRDLAQAQARQAATSTSAQVATASRVLPSSEQVSRVLRQVPQQQMVDYAEEVQPVLLKGCATAACHGSASSTALRFMPLSGGRDREKRIGQRNLFSVLSQVDRASPDNSPLLRAMQEPHPAGEKVSIDAADYELVAKWVHDLSGPQVASRPATLDRRRAHLMQRFEQAPAETPLGRQPARTTPTPRARVGAGQPALQNELPEPPESPLPDSETEAVDPFDPSAFNRQFFPEQP
jgi:chromatin segregation and condensation protein Rec8/ScpA/Scc1 (kleisin family)